MMKPSICVLPLAVLVMTVISCARDPGRAQVLAASDLTERFTIVVPGGGQRMEPRNSLVRHFKVVRNGDRRDAMLIVAPATIRASLAGISGRVLMEGLAAPVFNIGDGMQLDVFLIDSHRSRKVYGRYFDPGRRAQDRAWIPLEIPLDLERASDLQIEIRLSAGAQGDLSADWLALSSLRIVRKGA